MSSPPTELAQAPQHGFRGDADAAPPARPRGLTVAISREAGARGTTIARRVADILAWQAFDGPQIVVRNHIAVNVAP